MAGNNGRKETARPRRAKLTYFFLNDQLHKKLFISRGRDLLVAWNYPEGKKVSYDYSTVLRRHKRAWKTVEVAQMINRHRRSIDSAIASGMIERPQFTYGLDEHRRIFQYMWRDEDVMGALEYFATVHQGRPRKDGEITVNNLPTPRELRAMMNQEQILYVKEGDGFIPSWRAREF